MHLVADLKSIKIALNQTVAVKVQLAAFMRQDEAVIVFGIELRHLAGKGFGMRMSSTSTMST